MPDTIVVPIVQHVGEGFTAAEWAAIIAALTALVAVVVGPLSSYQIAKKQIRAGYVSANRQAWINELRERLADVSTALFELGVAGMNKDKETYSSALARAVYLKSKIEMMINPHEDDHRSLMDQISKGVKAASAGDGSSAADARDELIRTAQLVFKREWERVKKGE